MSRSALVIGSGIVGVSSAHFLAEMGWKVTIVDRGTYLDLEDIGGLVDASFPGADEIFGLLVLAQLLTPRESTEERSSWSSPGSEFFGRRSTAAPAKSPKGEGPIQVSAECRQERAPARARRSYSRVFPQRATTPRRAVAGDGEV